jgi:hypothetical protein
VRLVDANQQTRAGSSARDADRRLRTGNHALLQEAERLREMASGPEHYRRAEYLADEAYRRLSATDDATAAD